MTLQTIRTWIIRLLIGYFIIGSVYYLSGYLYNLAIGKDLVFAHIVGFPLTVMGWPSMLYGDLVNIHTLGIRIPTVLTLLALAAMLALMILKAIKEG